MRPRHLESALRAALETFRVVQITGARQVGKTTLALALSQGERVHVSFDDLATRERASADPDGFLATFGTAPLLIDEVQRVPEIYLAIKRIVDLDSTRGRFLLTGSAEPAKVSSALDSLTGRIGIVDLRPFSQAELHASDPLDPLGISTDADPAWRSTARRGLAGYIDDIVAGGFPEPLELPADRRADWHAAYLAATFSRDVRETTNVSDTGRLARLFRLIASHSGQLLKPGSLARDADLAKNTAASWTTALAATRVIDVIPAWTPGERGRLVSTPKAYVIDTGLLAATLGVSSDRVLADPMLSGTFCETFAVGEILKLLGTMGTARPRPYHYRDRDQREIDLLLEDSDGRIVAIEVKASARTTPGDARHINALRRRLGDRFRRGIVLYCGEHPLPLADQVTAVPIANLWSESDP